jgi:hypothetical protein
VRRHFINVFEQAQEAFFPNEPASTRLAGALLLKQNDEWQL